MKESFGLIIITFLALVLALSIWNLLIMYKIKKTIKGKSSITANELYIELKSRIQLITTIFSIVVVILTYFGFTTEDRIKQRINDQVSEEFRKYDTIYKKLNEKQDSALNTSMEVKNILDNFDKQLETLNNKLTNATRQIPESNIRAIAKLLAQTYLVNLLDHGPTVDAEPYSIDYIKRESEKIYHLLIVAGFSSSEAKAYFQEITKNTRVENKINISN